MPTRATKRCSIPGCTDTAGRTGHCTTHAVRHEAARRRLIPTKAARTPDVRRHRANAVAAHVQRHGWVCLGDKDHQRHATRDLTADDPIPIARGGDPMQPLIVMCRSANSRLGARPR